MASSIGYIYLLSRKFRYNGGFIGKILSETTILSANNSGGIIVQIGNTDIGQYIKDYFLNATKSVPEFDSQSGIIRSYEFVYNTNLVTTNLGITYIIISGVICLLFSLFWILYQALWQHPQLQIWWEKLNIIFSKYKSSIQSQKITVYSNEDLRNKEKYILNKKIIFLIICCVLSVLYCICFILSVHAQISLQKQLNSIDTNNSLISSWRQASKYIESFFNMILIDSYQMFNQTIANMSNTMQSSLTSALNNLISNLMLSFGVVDLFSTLSKLLININVTVNNMQYIRITSPTMKSNIDNLKGQFSVYQSQLKKNIQRVCVETANNSQCMQYLNDVSQLYVPIDNNKINTESSINMIFVLQQFRLNLSQLTTQVQNLQLSFNNKLQDLTNAKVNELNVAQNINNIGIFWNFISSYVTTAKNNFTQISTDVDNFIINGTIIFITITAIILVFIFIIFAFYLFSTLRYAIIYYFERETFLNIMELIQPNIKRLRFVNKLKKDYHPSPWIIYIFLSLFSLILILLILCSVLSIAISEIVYNESCTQLWNPAGLKNTDKILNSFVTNQWNYVTKYIASLDIPIQITLSKPNQIIESFQMNCTNNTGIIGVLQWTNMINISSFLWSPQNTNALKSGLNHTYNTVIGIDTTSLMPPDLTAFLQMASDITKYFDGIDYTVTLNELSKGVIVMKDMPEWLNSSLNYFSSIQSQHSNIVIQSLQDVQSIIPDINNLQTNVSNLKNSYIQLQERRINNNLITQLLNEIKLMQSNFKSSPQTYETVAKAYSSIMMTNFTLQAEILLSSSLRTLLKHIFPCQDLSKAFTLLLNNTCNNHQLLENSTNYGFVLVILSISLVFMFHFLWILIRIDFNENAEANVSSC